MPNRPLLFVLILVSIAGETARAADAPPISLDSPAEHQVFQRQSPTRGVIVLTGHAPTATKIEYRLTGHSLQAPLPGDWHQADVDPATHQFHQDFPTPAGGWYRLEIRPLDAPNSTLTIEHVGVGEIFVVAGQSNSTNYGAEKQKPASDLVVSFDGAKWSPALDPQPGTYDHSTGGSFIPAFGDAMAKKYKLPIAIASTGNGATSVRQWLPKGEKVTALPTIDAFMKKTGPHEWESTGQLYDHLMKRIQALGPHGFRAILWHQGESDAGQARAGYPADRQITGDQYRAYLETLIRATRKQATWDIPWFVAQATYHSESDAADEEFRAAQLAVTDNKLTFQGPDTDALRKDHRAGVHFNAKGQIAHGNLWAEKVSAYLDDQLRP